MAIKAGVLRVDGREIEISRPEKVLFPEDGITKGDLIEYYARIAPHLLLHLRDRPLTLERYPNGINGKRFFQKEVSSYFPKWLRRVAVPKVGGTVTHLVCNDTASLVYIANQACVTPHICLTRIDKLDVPDQLVFDLDPQGDDFDLVRSTALDLKRLLGELELPAFLKTTGSRGLHVVVPLQRREKHDAVHTCAREIAEIIVSRSPKERTMEALKANRGDRVFIDINRNGYAQLVAPAYVVRARKGAPVSVPLDWDELEKKSLRSNSFTIRNVFDRLEPVSDPWAAFWKSAVSLAKARRKLATLALTLWLTTQPAAALQRPCDSTSPLGPSRDLYCIELVPAPGIPGATGRVELGHVTGPFTVAVARDGRPRYHLILSTSGLPSPRTLGPYGTYVAWVARPTMDSVERLGPIRNGRTPLGVVEREKFTFLITAEPKADAKEPSGRLVLRGQSPATRLFPPDLLLFSIGSMPQSSGGQHPGHSGTADAARAVDSALRWTTVPMPPGLTMLPAEMALHPDVAPWLPSSAESIAPVRGRELVRLKEGDTLRLEAGLVRRTLKGRDYTMFAFNGQQPGPLIEVVQGSRITVVLKNRLPLPTTVHWHGIRLENRNDGTPDLTQPAVPPGGEFTYRLQFPDAGIYWYHPHVREDIQQELGLYGNLVVRPAKGDGYGPANREAVLMLDDVLISEDGMVPLGRESPTHALMGRFGNTLLVNGEPGYRLRVQRGEVVRFFLTNAANARTLNLSFAGARMKLVASDVGTYEHEQWVDNVVIAPAERYVVHVRFDRPGKVALLNRVRGLDHVYGRFLAQTDTLGVVEVSPTPIGRNLAESFAVLRRERSMTDELERYRRLAEQAPQKTLILTVETKGLPPISQRLMQLDSIYFAPVEWSGTMPMMNWASTGRQVRWILRDPETGRENMDVNWRLRRDQPVRIRLVNQRQSVHAMQHPIHLHGQRFLILAVNGEPTANLVWKDTVLVPAGGAVDILLDPSNPGRWMAHCHIAEHLSAGMMMGFTVE